MRGRLGGWRSGPLRVPLPLRTDDLINLGFHQLVHHSQPDTHAQREQSLPRGADELAKRLLGRHVHALSWIAIAYFALGVTVLIVLWP